MSQRSDATMPCGHLPTTEREAQVNMCAQCEIDFHACSTGDCPHEKQTECDDALAVLKAEQRGDIVCPHCKNSWKPGRATRLCPFCWEQFQHGVSS